LIVTPEATGESQKFTTGDYFVIPKGFTDILETLGEPFRELAIVETKTFTDDDMAD